MGHTFADDGTEQALYRRLMVDYERDVRPTHDHRRATNVTLGFSLNQLVDVVREGVLRRHTRARALQDEKNQVLTTRSWMNINWLDGRLAWNRSSYNGLDVVYTPHHRVWKPDIMLTNKYAPSPCRPPREHVAPTRTCATRSCRRTWRSDTTATSPGSSPPSIARRATSTCATIRSTTRYDGCDFRALLRPETPKKGCARGPGLC